MYIYIYIFIRAACVSECACVFFLTTFGCCCRWCYYRFLFRTPSRSLSLSCTRSLSIFLTVSLLSLSRVIGVAIGYCVSVSVLRITFFSSFSFCLSINLQYASKCWPPLLMTLSQLYFLAIFAASSCQCCLAPSSPAPPAHANVKKSFIHTDGNNKWK